jgi:tetratricopeptide (TPR) repeat protein
MFRLLIKRISLFSLCISLPGVVPTYAQKRSAPANPSDVNRRFFAEEGRCRALVKEQKWQESETVCKTAVSLADRLPSESKLEKMGAYEMFGHVLMGQNRYREALNYYTRALDFVRPVIKETDAELARLYGNIAIAHHSLRDLDKAREMYRKSERSFQLAYENIGKGDVSDESDFLKQQYLKSLKRILGFHLIAAEQAGVVSEVEEVRKLMAGLP